VKRCPHCADSAIADAVKVGDETFYRLRCLNPECPTRKLYETERDARFAWNGRRPLESTLADLRDVLAAQDVATLNIARYLEQTEKTILETVEKLVARRRALFGESK
jgi:hypothetical protein